MIERLIETHDLKKIFHSPNCKKALISLFEKENFLEIAYEKHFIIGLKPKGGCETLLVESPDILLYLREIRDNLHPWNELTSTKRIAHKQLLTSLQKSCMFEHLNKRLDPNLFKDSLKISNKIHDFNTRMQILHDRLQGVFLISGNKKDIANSFDSHSSVIVTKIKPASPVNDICWVREVKYATTIVLCHDDLPLQKYLKNNEFEKLTIDKKKSKNIWIKNNK